MFNRKVPPPTVQVIESQSVKDFLNYVKNKPIEWKTTATEPKTTPTILDSRAAPIDKLLSDMKKQRQDLASAKVSKKFELPWDVIARERALRAAMEADESEPIDDCVKTEKMEKNQEKKEEIVELPKSSKVPQMSVKDCLEFQETEVSSLQSFYGHDFMGSDAIPRRFAIRFMPKNNPSTILQLKIFTTFVVMSVYLVVLLSPQYPHVWPFFAIRWSSIFELDDQQLLELNNLLKKKLMSLEQENTFVFPLAHTVQEFIDKLPEPVREASQENTDSLKLLLSANYT
jgi:hypothetical protein